MNDEMNLLIDLEEALESVQVTGFGALELVQDGEARGKLVNMDSPELSWRLLQFQHYLRRCFTLSNELICKHIAVREQAGPDDH